MLSPAVARLKLDAQAALPIRLGIIASLFQTERVHADDRVVPGQGLAPVGERARNPIAQHARVTGEEVDQVAGLQGKRVARILSAQVFEGAGGVAPAPGGDSAYGFEVILLAFVRGQR